MLLIDEALRPQLPHAMEPLPADSRLAALRKALRGELGSADSKRTLGAGHASSLFPDSMFMDDDDLPRRLML